MNATRTSQSAFVRGFIDDRPSPAADRKKGDGLNPRSCAASSMTSGTDVASATETRLNPRSCAASSMTTAGRAASTGCSSLNPRSCAASSMTRPARRPSGS